MIYIVHYDYAFGMGSNTLQFDTIEDLISFLNKVEDERYKNIQIITLLKHDKTN